MTAHDLPLLLDRGSSVPLAAQLAQALRRAILDGTLRHDEPVPSSRTLAASVRVSRGTVVAAYDQLAGEGYLVTRPGAATRISVHTPAEHGVASWPGQNAAPAPAAPTPSIEAPATLTIDLAPGHPSVRGLVDPAWTSAWRTAVAASGRADSPPAEGTERLRTAIAEHVRRARGLACHPDDISVTAGTSDALAVLGLALRDTLKPGPAARIAVEDPGYPAARRVLRRVGARLVPVPVGDNAIDLAALAALTPAPDAVLVTPSHQYPLGGSLSVQHRLDLLGWAESAGAVVVEDDYDSEFRFDAMPLPALATLDTTGRVALVGSFSKTVTPWVRCGYIVATGPLGSAVRAVRQDLGPTVSGVQQLALAGYLESGGLARNIARVRREYVHRRGLVLSRLGALPGVRLSGLDGGLHVVVHLDPAGGADAARLVADAAARGVRVASLADYAVTDYAVTDRGQHGLVLGYGAPTDLDLGRALDVLADLIRSAQLPPSSRRSSAT